MSLTYSIDSDLGILRITVIGEPSFHDQEELAREWSQDPAFRPGMPILLDNRQRSTTSTPSEVREIAREVEGSPILAPGTRCAVVVPHEVEFGMTRMFALLSDESPLKTRPFHEMDQAVEWLCSEEDAGRAKP
jgi:hypothetical protein